jgi:hypothetical protein
MEKMFLFAQMQVFEGGRKTRTHDWNKGKRVEGYFDSQICVFILFFMFLMFEIDEMGYGC